MLIYIIFIHVHVASIGRKGWSKKPDISAGGKFFEPIYEESLFLGNYLCHYDLALQSFL